jgi:hypothetical protein
MVALFIRVYRAIVAIGVECRLYARQIAGRKVREWQRKKSADSPRDGDHPPGTDTKLEVITAAAE